MPTATKKKPVGKPAKAKEASPVQGRGDLASGSFTYPAILTEGSQEKHEGTGNWQVVLIFERHDKQWDDGNPVKQYVRATTWFAKSGGAAGPESEADVISKSFAEATGDELDILSDESIQGFIGHSFMLTDEDTGREYEDKNGKTRKAYITTCLEYLGDDSYEYEGKVQVVQGTGGGSATAFDAATYMASLFDGQSIDDLKGGDALNIVKDDEKLAEVKMVLDKSTRGGLTKPRAVLIDRLIEEGYATDEDGIFTVTGVED